MKKINITKAIELISGNALMAFAIGAAVYMKDNLGGTSGLASILAEMLNLPLSVMVILVNGIFFLEGWIFLGRGTAVKSAGSILLFPLFLNIVEMYEYPLCRVMNPLVSAVFDGVILGLSVCLILDAGASTGGFDIPGLILQKRTGINPSIMMCLGDVAVILFQSRGFTMSVLYGIVISATAALTSSFVSRFAKARVHVKHAHAPLSFNHI